MILLLGVRDRPWLRVAAEAIRVAARRDGLVVPSWVDALELAASAGLSGSSSAQEDLPGDSVAVPLLYKPDEAAEMLSVSPTTVKRLIASGELRAVKVLNDRRIARADLLEFVERRRNSPASAS